jgi:hypothetical protein
MSNPAAISPEPDRRQAWPRTCPKCGARRWIEPNQAGDEPHGRRAVLRSCRACGHTWTAAGSDDTSAAEEEREEGSGAKGPLP